MRGGERRGKRRKCKRRRRWLVPTLFDKQVLAILQEGPQTSQQIAEQLGWSRELAYMVLNVLVNEQRVSRVFPGSGKWEYEYRIVEP